MFRDSRGEIDDITELLTSGEVEIDSVKYLYSYEEDVVATDRVFAFQEVNTPSTHLFQLIPIEGEKNTDYQRLLNSLNMQDPKVYRELINTGKSLMERVEGIDISEISLKDLKEEIELNSSKFSVMYASPNIEMAGISMRENLEKRLKGRVRV